MTYAPPPHDCPLCPRLAAFRADNRRQHPDFFNAPVPSFGALDAELLVVGLAPGLKGANRTGRPFTGDYAGLVLYSALKKFGFAAGEYDPEKVASGRWPGGDEYRSQATGHRPHHAADGFHLINCRITNAVRCVPPENKPEPAEIKTCNAFLKSEIAAMGKLKVILSLGQISHKGVLMALGHRQSAYKFGHGAEHRLKPLLVNSYHCSRYNINTGALTQAMFDEVVGRVANVLSAAAF